MAKKLAGRVKVAVRGELEILIDPNLNSETIMRAAVAAVTADPTRYLEFRPNVTSRRRVLEYDALRAAGVGAPTEAQRALPPEAIEIQIVYADDNVVAPATPADVPADAPLVAVRVHADSGGSSRAKHACACACSPCDEQQQHQEVGSELSHDEPVPGGGSCGEEGENSAPGGVLDEDGFNDDPGEYEDDDDDEEDYVDDNEDGDTTGDVSEHGEHMKLVDEERPWLPPGLQRSTALPPPPDRATHAVDK